MANHVINIDPLNPNSIARAEEEMQRVAKDFDRKVDTFIRELGKIGQEAAQGAYGSAVAVTLDENESGLTINANGKAVVFLEFGAGSSTNSTNRYANTMPFSVKRGSYSTENKGEYWKSGFKSWTFGGVEMTAVEPRNGMQKAYEAIMQDIASVAKRVFG